MKSPAAIGGLLLLGVVLLAGRWAVRNYVPLPETPAPTGRVQTVGTREALQRALSGLAALPPAERAALRAGLRAALTPLPDWLSALAESDWRVLCIGESHSEATRAFLAARLMSALPADRLMLEATEPRLRAIERAAADADATRREPLLGADMAAVVRAARRRNPDLRVFGIEETAAQRAARDGVTGTGLRDASMAENFWRHHRPGDRHLLLVGALHCSGDGRWLFDQLARAAPPELEARLRSVTVREQHESGPVEALVYVAEELGVAPRDFAIEDSRALPAELRHWLRLDDLLADHGRRTLLVFRAAGRVP